MVTTCLPRLWACWVWALRAQTQQAQTWRHGPKPKPALHAFMILSLSWVAGWINEWGGGWSDSNYKTHLSQVELILYWSTRLSLARYFETKADLTKGSFFLKFMFLWCEVFYVRAIEKSCEYLKIMWQRNDLCLNMTLLHVQAYNKGTKFTLFYLIHGLGLAQYSANISAGTFSLLLLYLYLSGPSMVFLHICHEYWLITETSDHTVFFRLTITASCPMDLQYFPMDSQLCYIEIESCKYLCFIFYS